MFSGAVRWADALSPSKNLQSYFRAQLAALLISGSFMAKARNHSGHYVHLSAMNVLYFEVDFAHDSFALLTHSLGVTGRFGSVLVFIRSKFCHCKDYRCFRHAATAEHGTGGTVDHCALPVKKAGSFCTLQMMLIFAKRGSRSPGHIKQPR